MTVIDWDFCRPGDPTEDLAFSAWQWIPLWADKTAVATGHGGATTALLAATRLAALVDGYDASPEQRLALVDACVAAMTKHAEDIEAMAVTGPAFAASCRPGYSHRRTPGRLVGARERGGAQCCGS